MVREEDQARPRARPAEGPEGQQSDTQGRNKRTDRDNAGCPGGVQLGRSPEGCPCMSHARKEGGQWPEESPVPIHWAPTWSSTAPCLALHSTLQTSEIGLSFKTWEVSHAIAQAWVLPWLALSMLPFQNRWTRHLPAGPLPELLSPSNLCFQARGWTCPQTFGIGSPGPLAQVRWVSALLRLW